MRLNSDSPLAKELRDPEVREHTVAAQVRIGIPFQLRAMREMRGWTQEAMARKLGTTQNTISRLENPRTGKPTIKTLLRIARVFDVGLLVRFVPFGFYRDVIEAMDATHIEIPSYDEELANEGDNPVLLLSSEKPKQVAAAPTLGAMPTFGDRQNGDQRPIQLHRDDGISLVRRKPKPTSMRELERQYQSGRAQQQGAA